MTVEEDRDVLLDIIYKLVPVGKLTSEQFALVSNLLDERQKREAAAETAEAVLALTEVELPFIVAGHQYPEEDD